MRGGAVSGVAGRPGRRPDRHGTRALVAAVAAAVVAAVVGCTAAPQAPPPPPGGTPVPPPPARDPALVSLSVLPPGNGNLSGPTAVHLDDQRSMYDRLEDAVAAGGLTDGQLSGFFKEARLGPRPAVRVDEPTPGVRVEWDAAGVPRVVGDTAEQVAWGAGWTVAEGRLLLAELGRLLGRAGTLEMGGADIVGALAQVLTLPQINYTDAELEAGLDEAVAAAGAEGPAMLSAIDAFVAGLNAWLDTNAFPPELQALGLHWRHWTRADVLAVGVVVDDIFGSGGGDEVGNAHALAGLVTRLGPTAGRAAFDDLRTADVPTATSHTTGTFPYPLFARADGGGASTRNAVDPAAVALPDAPVAAAGPVSTPTMSNYVAVTGDRTRSGHPVLVGGPQSSYFAPQLLFEMELQGGGYDTRGVTFPGLGPWVVLGRGRSYAWTATAGGSDLTDQRIERLCEPGGSPASTSSTHYVFQGQCRPMTRPDDGAMTAWRTVHGPVVGRATVGGAPVAVSRERMSRARTALAAPAFWALNRGLVRHAREFAPTMATVPMSFNWVYVDAHHVATFHSGFYPVRARGVDPDLPSWGTGEWEWRGRVDWRRQPQEVDPPSGWTVSWNNKVAPGWHEPDNDWDAGEVHRVDLLARRAASLGGDVTPAEVVAVAQDVATVDVRGALVLPQVLAVLDGSAAPDPATAASLAELRAWVGQGAHRRDLDDDGRIDDHAVAVMDALWERLVHAVFGPTLGPYLDDPAVRRPRLLDNPPSQTGGAYAHGWYSLVVRDLRRVLDGGPRVGPFPACGGGAVTRCREALWSALSDATLAAGPDLRSSFFERIRFLPYLFNLQSMRWVNRPTFQQVVSFGDGRP